MKSKTELSIGFHQLKEPVILQLARCRHREAVTDDDVPWNNVAD